MRCWMWSRIRGKCAVCIRIRPRSFRRSTSIYCWDRGIPRRGDRSLTWEWGCSRDEPVDRPMDRTLSMLRWRIEGSLSCVECECCTWSIVDESTRSFSPSLHECRTAVLASYFRVHWLDYRCLWSTFFQKLHHFSEREENFFDSSLENGFGRPFDRAFALIIIIIIIIIEMIVSREIWWCYYVASASYPCMYSHPACTSLERLCEKRFF